MDNPTGNLYYVEYSRKLAGGDRIKLRDVMNEESLAWYFTNYSERYQYIIESARIATQEEIEEFAPKDNEYE